MAAALCRLRRARPADDRRPRRGRSGFDVDVPAAEPWPLLGECAPDDEQLALVSDAFRAPVFPHGAPDAAAPVTDFLLCLAPRPRRARRDGPPEPWTWVVRPLDGDHLVALQGQVEPRIEVPPLGSKRAAARHVSGAAAGAVDAAGRPDERSRSARAFRTADRAARDPRPAQALRGAPGAHRRVPRRARSRSASREAAVREIAVPLDEIQRALFCNTHVPAALLKRAVADVAEKVAVDADDVATRFAPEDVCAYESANAAARACGRWASRRRRSSAGPAARRRRARARPPLRRRAEARGRPPRARAGAGAAPDDSAAARRRRDDAQRRRAPQRTGARKRSSGASAARRVHEEIGLAPAHLTSGFVDARIRGANFAILRLGGLGDPSGVGAGFSFARASLAQFRSAASRTGAGGAEKPASLAESRDAYQAQIALVAAARALKRTLADMARGDDDEADDGRLLVGDREFRKRGKRGPYRNSTRYDDARAEKRAPPRRWGGAAGLDDGAGGAPAPAPAPADDGSDLDLSDLENDLLDDLAGGDGGDGRKAATARDDAKELEALRRDLKDQEERKRDAAARDALRGESGEPEAIRRPPPVPPRYAVRRVSRTFAGGREKVSVTFDVSEGAVERVAARTGVELPPERAPPPPGGPSPRGGKKKTVITFSAQALADAEKDGGPAPKAKKGSVKLNISSLMAKHDEHKAEQRRAKEQRMKDDAASYHRRPAPSRRTAPRQGGGAQNKPHVLTPLFRRPAPAGAFFKPVDKKQFPQYYVKITDPVDLTTIKERLGRYVYRARSALLKDLALMAANAAAFNGPAHPIALEGKAMVDAAEAAAADHADELDALERETREQTALAPPLALMGGEDSSRRGGGDGRRRRVEGGVLCPGQNEGDRCYCGAEASGENDCTLNPSLCECAEARACCAGEAWDNVVWSTPAYAPPPLRGGAFTDVDGAVKLVVATVDGALVLPFGTLDDGNFDADGPSLDAYGELPAALGLAVAGAAPAFGLSAEVFALLATCPAGTPFDAQRAVATHPTGNFVYSSPGVRAAGCPYVVHAYDVSGLRSVANDDFPLALDPAVGMVNYAGSFEIPEDVVPVGAAAASGAWRWEGQHVAVLAGGGAGALFLDFTDDPLAPAIVAHATAGGSAAAASLGDDDAYHVRVATPAGDRFDAVKNMPTTTTTRPPATTTASATTPDAERECSELVRGLEGKAMKQGKCGLHDHCVWRKNRCIDKSLKNKQACHKLKKPTKKKLKKSCKKKAYCKWKKKTCDSK
ncbi:hypothetical protein JL722_11034 [Aureococcus anophagefferens]|nr:hypothetical protein JL722_11034 [Aureococcus anophagefferens]